MYRLSLVKTTAHPGERLTFTVPCGFTIGVLGVSSEFS